MKVTVKTTAIQVYSVEFDLANEGDLDELASLVGGVFELSDFECAGILAPSEALEDFDPVSVDVIAEGDRIVVITPSRSRGRAHVEMFTPDSFAEVDVPTSGEALRAGLKGIGIKFEEESS